jgi:hypothetical protein
MPAAIRAEPPPLPKWQRPAKTTDNLPWADIIVLDMSKYDLPGGRHVLAEELRHAVSAIQLQSLVDYNRT